MTEQQRIFSEYGLAQWQQTLGPDGVVVTAIMFGLYMMIFTAFFVIYKHQCFLAASAEKTPAVMQTGEYDEKGRWYKY
jgi:hypothetical protein